MQNAWVASKAEEIQRYTDRNEWKNFFSAIKTAYSPPAKEAAPFPGTDGNRHVCDNNRDISLLNIAGKIFVRILLNRLSNHLEQGLLSESQRGFRRHRRTTDTSFSARQLQEKCREIRTHLYSTFVDLTKTFGTVNNEGLWKIIQKFDCPEQFTQMVRQLHNGMMERVMDSGAVSEAFAVTHRMKQGCVLAPTLFSLMLSAMLMDAYRDEHPGIRVAYRTDGHLLNQRRMHFQSYIHDWTQRQPLFVNFWKAVHSGYYCDYTSESSKLPVKSGSAD
nr:unnamed protein product [Spirometra erinaceieuropaei]